MPDSTQPILVRRSVCPACAHGAITTLFTEALDGPGIARYMRDRHAGRVTRDFAGHDHELARCPRCALAFQALVPAPR